MRKQVFILLSALILSACASLTKTQVESVNGFAKTARNFSDYPSTFMRLLFEVREKRGVFYAVSKSSSNENLNEVDAVLAEKKNDFAFTEQVDLSFKIIDQYAQALMLLSSDEHEKALAKESEKLGINLDKFVETYNKKYTAKKIPEGIGAAAGQLVLFAGKQYSRIRQAQYIKEFVAKGDSLIGVITGNLVQFMERTKIDALIQNEETGIREGYKFYLARLISLNCVPSINDQSEYMRLKENMENVKTLRGQTIKATKDLRKAHAKLYEEIKKKKKLKETIEELSTLYEEVREIKSKIEEIEKK